MQLLVVGLERKVVYNSETECAAETVLEAEGLEAGGNVDALL